MDGLTTNLIKHRIKVLIAFGILTVLSLLLMQMVPVNYDLAEYLPENSMTKQAIKAMKDAFGYPGMADVMVENVSIAEAKALKEQIKSVSGVKNVTWLDDVTDVNVPEHMIPDAYLKSFYKDGAALYKVEFHENDYHPLTGTALTQIRELLEDRVSISGTAEDSQQMRSVLAREIFMIILVVFPLCVIILMFASTSWIEPFIYLLVIGVSIAINMGTNIIFPRISFITRAMAAVLQLAISMDYSLFLFHRYNEARDEGADVMTAIKAAAKNSLSSISASALTTIAGFLALLFMQYGIGADIGLVLAKGIILSFFCVMLLMPVVIYMLNKVIDKTRHKPFVPSFASIGRLIIKLRYPIFILAVIITIPAFLAQQKNAFLYGDTSGSAGQSQIAAERQKIEERFGVYNPVMLLVPNGNVPAEKALAEDLKADSNIKDVQSLVTLADDKLPRMLLPDNVKEQFESDKYSRIIVLLEMSDETPESYEAVETIKNTAQRYYPDQWLAAGKASSITDIKQSVEKDSRLVLLFSIISVGIIVMFTFKSLSLPVLLVSAIQMSIWFNMSIPYFEGYSLVYIGYLVVSSLQLGATIDYAILLSNRYLEFRRTESPKQAAVSAIKTAGFSVTISALILAVAGYAEGVISQIDSISVIGNLLGRGAALSGLSVIFVLPVLLVLFDKIIMRTTLNTKTIIVHDRKAG